MAEADFENRCKSSSDEAVESHADFETLHSMSDNTLDSTGNKETGYRPEEVGHRQEAASHPQEAASHPQEAASHPQEAAVCSSKSTGYSQEAASRTQEAAGCSSKATGYSQEAAGCSSKSTGYSQEDTGFSPEAALYPYGEDGQPQGAAVNLQAAAVYLQAAAVYLKAAEDYPPGKDVYPHAVAVCLHALVAYPQTAGVYQHAAAEHSRTLAGSTDEASEQASVLRPEEDNGLYVPSESVGMRIGDFEDNNAYFSVIMLRWKFMKVAIDLKSWRIKTREQSRILSSYVDEGNYYFSILNDTSTAQKLSDQEICFVHDTIDRLGCLCLMFDQNNKHWFSVRFTNTCTKVPYLLSRIRNGAFLMTKENAEEILEHEQPMISSLLRKMKYLKPLLQSVIINASQTLESMHFLLSELRLVIKK